MADRPITSNLPADLPENWQNNQIVSPNGTEAGLDEKHGFNYLGKMLNKAHATINAINAAFDGLAPLTHTHTKSQITDFPTSMTPTAHKSTHAIGGADALTVTDIGAAAASHTHGNVTSAGQIGGVTLDSTLVRLVSGALQTLEGTATGMQIATGSYTGTGTYGSGNKNSLTFPFVPKLIYITASTMTNGYGDTITLSNWKLWHNGLVNAYVGYSGDNAQDTYSVNIKTFSWYNNRNATAQLNYSGQQYYYTAIG